MALQGSSYGQAFKSSQAQIIVIAGAPASIIGAGHNQQTGTVNAARASPLEALVSDAQGNPVSGANVGWGGGSGEGHGLDACAGSTTNSLGIATCQPTLGQTAGAKSFTALVSTLSVSTTPVAGDSGVFAAKYDQRFSLGKEPQSNLHGQFLSSHDQFHREVARPVW